MSQHDIDPIETLRAELSKVEVSPDFTERVRRQVGEDAIASIGAELSDLSVSPEFAVRVRQQIEAAPARPGWLGFLNWRWAVPVAAAAVMLVAIVLSRGGNPVNPGAEPAAVTARGPEAPRPPQTVARAPQGAQPASGAPAAVSPRSVPVPVVQRTASPVAASGQKLEFITYQPAVYRQLWAAAAAATVVESAALPIEVRDLAIAVVEVKPVVVPWLVEPPVGSGGSVPDIRRVSAAAERSDK
jgi:hypothetical protein